MVIMAVCVGVVGVSSTLDWLHLGEYRDRRYFEQYNEELELAMTQALKPNAARTDSIFLPIGHPRQFLPTRDYLLPQLEGKICGR